MKQWPQYVVLIFVVVKYMWHISKDLDHQTPRDRFVGLVVSTLIACGTIFVLDQGGFFK